MTTQETSKVIRNKTRALHIAEQIQAELGGRIKDIRPRVAGIIYRNPMLTDDEVAFCFAAEASHPLSCDPSVELRDIPKGEYFRLKDVDGATTYKKEEYVRSERKFQVTNCNDIWGNGRMLKGSTRVFIGFTY